MLDGLHSSVEVYKAFISGRILRRTSNFNHLPLHKASHRYNHLTINHKAKQPSYNMSNHHSHPYHLRSNQHNDQLPPDHGQYDEDAHHDVDEATQQYVNIRYNRQ